MMQLAAKHPECRFSVAGMTLIGEEYYRKFIPAGISNVDIRFDGTYQLLSEAESAVVCSGTATLETALFRVPQVVCYQCNRLSAAIARVLIGNKIKYISLVNLIADRPVVRELIQGQFNLKTLVSEFCLITSNDERRSAIMAEYDRLIAILGGPGASARTADEITSIVKQ